MRLPKIVGLFVPAILSACATYTPQSLPTQISLANSASAITVNPAKLRFRELNTHIFNPADGLDSDEVAMIAVVNNPQLRQARDGLGVAQAQSFAAGLLPDPQLGLTFDHPTNGSIGNTNAFNFLPSFDVNALLLRSSRAGAAKADERRVNLGLLWQEWQVVSQARLLFTRITVQQALLVHLQITNKLLADRYSHSQQALTAGNTTLDSVSADLTALQNVGRQINELERSHLQNRASLNGLLGIAVDAPLDLVGDPILVDIDSNGVRTGLQQRLNERPDIQALQEGYRSQEEKFRGAVLAQFPALNIGISRARDTSGLYTLGFGLNLNLPIFNANRGNIAIEKTTRQKLFDEYQDRLNSSYSEISTALENLSLLQSQLQQTRQTVMELDKTARQSKVVYAAGNMIESDYVRLQIALLDKQTEAINLQEGLMEQRIALETLLGPDLPKLNRNVQ